MKYGTLNLLVERGSTSIVNRSSKITRHYPATDRSDSHDLGRQATEIGCVALVKTDTERIMLEQIMNTHIERDLEIENFYYKRVVASPEHAMGVFSKTSDGAWRISLSFIALDPIPYDIATGGALY